MPVIVMIVAVLAASVAMKTKTTVTAADAVPFSFAPK